MKRTSITRVALSLAALIGGAQQAQADALCSYTMSSLNMTPDGWVNVTFAASSYSKGWWLCPVSGSTTINDGYSSKVINSDACKAIYSQLLTLKMAARPIVLVFHGPADCAEASLPASGTQPNPYPTNFLIW